MMSNRWMFLFWVSCLVTSLPAMAEVRIWEEEETLPTYPVGEPDVNPIFYEGRVYQGAQGRVYPYPLLEDLSDEAEPRAHKVVYLENEYLKIGVMPGPGGGGRIYLAEDKTNHYDFFYKQSVLKTGLIGVLGAWWSGGVEWNYPHHHRSSNFLSVDYTIEEHPDGGKTVWIGEIETRHRTKWMIGLTLEPKRSLLKMRVKLYNRTPLQQTFLFWSNVAVHVDENYQFIFPPSQRWVTHHGKHVYDRWPLAEEEHFLTRGGYKLGTDLSWWKSHEGSMSIFSIFSREDFFAGYNHGKDAGVVHVANHHLVPGKKMWSWGTDESAQMWDTILTDTDGPYIELMVGAYQDNQPDYSWLQPYEVKEFTQAWYPLREIEGVKNANLRAALNLEVREGGTVFFGVNASEPLEKARVVLNREGASIFDERVTISPARPFVQELALKEEVSAKDLRLVLLDNRGEPILSYQEQDLPDEPKPEVVEAPLPPAEVETIEELYLIGRRLEQFHSAALAPETYWEEALRRDPGDYRTNTALGIRLLKQHRIEEATSHLRRALERVTANQTIPREGDAYYYLGLCEKYRGNTAEAYRLFYRATWSRAYHTAAYFELAQIAAERKEYAKALDHVERALSTNEHHTKALNLRAVLLRETGELNRAREITQDILRWDPLNHWAAFEIYRASRDPEALGRWHQLMRGSFQNYLELSLDLAEAGLYERSLEVLDEAIRVDPEGQNPVTVKGRSLTERSRAMAYYLAGHVTEKLGRHEEARRLYVKASEQSPELVFPFRRESLQALRAALKLNPGDARAHFYLGNLLFESLPEQAVDHWEKARELEPTLATVHRNLALAYERVENDLDKALQSQRAALQADPSDPRLLLELDELMEAAEIAVPQRLALIREHQETALEHDEVVMRQAALHVAVGEPSKALELLEGRRFHVWEGGGDIHNIYLDAHLARGIERWSAGDLSGALRDFESALDYPVNLGVGRPRDGGRAPEVHYFIGKILQAQDRAQLAREHFLRSAEQERSRDSFLRVYQALSLKEFGSGENAEELLRETVDWATQALQKGDEDRFFAKFGEGETRRERAARLHFQRGLAWRGLDRSEKAREELRTAVDLDPTHLPARRELKALEILD